MPCCARDPAAVAVHCSLLTSRWLSPCCRWRSVVSIPSGPSTIAVRDCAYGLARYAAIAQSAGLVSSRGTGFEWRDAVAASPSLPCTALPVL